MTRPRIAYLAILAGSSLWCAAIIGAPLLADAGGHAAVAGAMLYEFFRPVCHQIDQRSFHILHTPLAVCIRCSAIYFSFLAGVILYPLVRSVDVPVLPHRRWLFAAAVPMLLDVAAMVLGVHESSVLTRTVSGAILGFLLAFYCLPVALDAARGRRQTVAIIPSARKEP